MVFLLAASVRSVSWLCDSKRSYFESTRPSMALAVLLLASSVLSGCLGGDDWDESELDFQDFYEHEYHICYDSEWRIFDCRGFPEYLEHVEKGDRDLRVYRWSDFQNGDLLKLTLSSHEDSSGMAVVTVTTQDKSDSFKLRSWGSESGIFEMSGTDRYLEVQLQADNGWFGDIVHYTIEVQIDTTYRDTDLDGYIDSEDFCGYLYGASSISHLGCPDSDGDGWSDTDEYACNTLPGSRNHTPSDLDGDGICNYLDGDVDGDGWDDSVELSCGADPFSPNSIPVVTGNNVGSNECHAVLLDGGGFWESAKGLIAAMAIIGTLVMILPERPDAALGAPRRREGAANGAGDYRERGYEDFTVAELKGLLRERGLPVSGRKAELISRLLDDMVRGLKSGEDDAEDDSGSAGRNRWSPRRRAEGIIGVFRNDVGQAVWVKSQNGQTIGDAVASSGLIGRDGTPWSINDQSGRHVDKSDPATSFWSQKVSVAFQ